MRWVMLCVLSACGRIGFDPHGNSLLPGDGGDTIDSHFRDAMIDGAKVVAPCVAAPGGSGFDTPSMTCAPWGMTFVDGAALVQSGSAITVTPTPHYAGPSGGCSKMNVPFTSDGIFLEVSSLIENFGGAVNTLNVEDHASPAQNRYQIFASHVPGTINAFVQVNGANTTLPDVPYDPVAHRFWRVRPEVTKVVIETSPDASTWTAIGESPHVATMVDITFGAEIIGTASATPGFARFEGIDACP